jgi:hypothetical protein
LIIFITLTHPLASASPRFFFCGKKSWSCAFGKAGALKPLAAAAAEKKKLRGETIVFFIRPSVFFSPILCYN